LEKIDMDTLVYEYPDDNDVDQPLPGRPRRKLLNRGTASLTALLLGAIGFLVGIRVEKSHQSGSSTSAVSSTAGTATGAASPTGARTSSHAGSARAGATGTRRPGASSSRGLPAAGATGATGGGDAGTVSSISGKTVYLKTTSGAVIKVRLTSATKLTKQLTVTRNSLRPGDTIAVTGVSGTGGSIKAATITDSGTSSSSSSSAASSSSSS
jgi:hypothetical protein